MEKKLIIPGQVYAVKNRFRQFEKVRLLEYVRGKWKTEWIDPHPGLIGYVEAREIVAPWDKLKAFEEEQKKAQRLREYNTTHGYTDEESPVTQALYEIFDNVKRAETEITFYKGILSGTPEALARLKERAGYNRQSPFVAHTDSTGLVNLPFDVAEDIAKGLCKAEPEQILLDLDIVEQKWAREITQGQDQYGATLETLREFRGAWALIRQWAGSDVAIAQRERRIRWLEDLFFQALKAMRISRAAPKEADRLQAEFEKGPPLR